MGAVSPQIITERSAMNGRTCSASKWQSVSWQGSGFVLGAPQGPVIVLPVHYIFPIYYHPSIHPFRPHKGLTSAVGKGVEGNGHDIIRDTVPVFAGRDWQKHLASLEYKVKALLLQGTGCVPCRSKQFAFLIKVPKPALGLSSYSVVKVKR